LWETAKTRDKKHDGSVIGRCKNVDEDSECGDWLGIIKRTWDYASWCVQHWENDSKIFFRVRERSETKQSNSAWAVLARVGSKNGQDSYLCGVFWRRMSN